MGMLSLHEIITSKGIFAKKFPVSNLKYKIKEIDIKDYKSLIDVSENFKFIFENSGYMNNGIIYTFNTIAKENKPFVLRQILEKSVDENLFLSHYKIKKFSYLRNSKKILRTRKEDGGTYYYSEGAMAPYDSLDLPGRTMLTSEGTVNRSSHIIKDPNENRLRFLSPIECERLNQFPDNWTSTMCNRKRYFMMGNALVCGIVSKLGNEIYNIIREED